MRQKVETKEERVEIGFCFMDEYTNNDKETKEAFSPSLFSGEKISGTLCLIATVLLTVC